jgi:DNA-binding NarL/FixJ family response regulator
MTDLTRVLVIENQKLLRLGIAAVLGSESGFAIVGETDSGTHGFDLFRRLDPDVTILGLRLPDSCAIDHLDEYLVHRRNARIIILADHAGDAEIAKSLKKGALGYICKDIEPDELVTAVKAVAGGRKYIPPEVAAILSEHIGKEELTKSEVRTLRMIVGGMSNKEIAFALDVTENTVKTHVKNIFEKLGVSDRTSAATTAIRRGLVRIDFNS